MKSLKHGKSISDPEITNISEHGFWLFFQGREYFLPYELYPWFKNAPVRQITNVKIYQQSHLYWPDLDVDLSVKILSRPSRYKLVWRAD